MNAKSNEIAEAILIVLKTIGKWILYALLAVLGLGLIFYVYLKVESYIENQPKVISSLQNVSIGEKLNDVLFKIDGLVQSDKELSNKEEIRYYNNNTGIGVDFTSGYVTGVLYGCRSDTDYFRVNRIRCNDTGESILEIYKDLRIVCDKEIANLRAYDAVDFGVRYYLVSNKVVAFRISNPSDLKASIGEDWKSCD
jgi:hypothetical protein